MPSYSQLRLARLAEAAARKNNDPTRHKCFVSYHHDDQDEVAEFINSFGHVFIPRVLGVSDEDDIIDSDDTDYIMDQIRERYLTDSTVTIVLVGKCTWARRYVDWEVFSTLRNDKKNRRSGLMAITLRSAANYAEKKLPARVADNVDNDKLYARWWKYPSSAEFLRGLIETAFQDRTNKADLIINSRPRKIYNSSC
ncbi:TIR domain-containing protein [Nonomuraea sp. NPDC005650]|uniref:TIR domain-containing protein n=1 Tax=Nonomuraea sp. NPDC005650 TaxID=3157045 RepID=UPI0033A7A0D3